MMDTRSVDVGLVHGIVLAAGEGRRLQRYVQEIRSEPLPKQYVNLIGRRSATFSMESARRRGDRI
jgi:CTP:molybdopterin cytidylyltransferase MocA